MMPYRRSGGASMWAVAVTVYLVDIEINPVVTIEED
jgi:hypothetical protein